MSNEEKIIELLEEILKWERLQGIGAIREIIPTLLDKDEKRLAYEHTDGEKTVRDLEKLVKKDKATISRWWNSWYSQGILVKKGNKYKNIISLSELGL